MFSNKPIVSKNPDGVLGIISIGRLSQPKETEAETQQSLEAIRKKNERMLASIYSGPSVVKYLSAVAAQRGELSSASLKFGQPSWLS